MRAREYDQGAFLRRVRRTAPQVKDPRHGGSPWQSWRSVSMLLSACRPGPRCFLRRLRQADPTVYGLFRMRRPDWRGRTLPYLRIAPTFLRSGGRTRGARWRRDGAAADLF